MRCSITGTREPTLSGLKDRNGIAGRVDATRRKRRRRHQISDPRLMRSTRPQKQRYRNPRGKLAGGGAGFHIRKNIKQVEMTSQKGRMEGVTEGRKKEDSGQPPGASPYSLLL